MRNKIMDYVRNQIGVDVNECRTDFTRPFERDDEIIIEHREMKRTDFRNLELLASSPQSKIRIESVGVWGKMIAYTV